MTAMTGEEVIGTQEEVIGTPLMKRVSQCSEGEETSAGTPSISPKSHSPKRNLSTIEVSATPEFVASQSRAHGFPWPDSFVLRWLLRYAFGSVEVATQCLIVVWLTRVSAPYFQKALAIENTILLCFTLFLVTYAVSLAQYFIVATTVDVLVDHAGFPESCRLQWDKRSQALKQAEDGVTTDHHGKELLNFGRRQYLKYHTLFTLRWALPIAIGAVLWIPRLKMDTLISGSIWLVPIKVQLALIFADMSYWAVHYTQHMNKKLYNATNHTFHHQFRYPWASVGTWLGTSDLLIATFAMGCANVFGTELLCGRLSLFEYLLMINFVHEMNCVDHSGCEVPWWTGCPFFPPLGLFMRWDKSIAMHEAHHNYNRWSYGLLGFTDILAGTAKYPPGYPDPDAKPPAEVEAKTHTS